MIVLLSCSTQPVNHTIDNNKIIFSYPIPEIWKDSPKRAWWQEAVFYEIFVRSFYDSDGNGIGDFNGITLKLDYLKSLGVTGIWLMPINPSPSYHGYDVLNYYAVNSEYGSLDDFKNLISEAHKRGIHVIIDLVINHTSIQHAWFEDAKSKPNSMHRDWYIWSSRSSGNKWYQENNGYYYAYFGKDMPDLNYKNPDVTNQIYKITSFWLNNIGVDGFRMDAAKHLIEEGQKLENTVSTHDWLKNFYINYKTSNPEAYIVGEVSGAGGLVAQTYAGELDQIFNFELANSIVNSVIGGSNSSLISAIKFSLQEKPDSNYATFLTNHDQNRIMSTVNGEIDKAMVAASVLLTLPGTPFIYYGEEVGLQGKKPDQDIRRPMQWTANINTGGFTTGNPWRPLDKNTVLLNVQTEESDPKSLLNHYRTLIKIRKQHSSLTYGTLSLIETENSSVYAILRKNQVETVIIIINLSPVPIQNYKLSLTEASLANGYFSPETIMGPGDINPLVVNLNTFTGYKPIPQLAPHSTTIIKIK